MIWILSGCSAMGMAMLVFALVREVRLRRAWQQLWFNLWKEGDSYASTDHPGIAAFPPAETWNDSEDDGVDIAAGNQPCRLRVKR
jgi:hypothetical protein